MAFGWNAVRVDGHDFNQLNDAFTSLKVGQGKPNVIICNTMRGKGLPSIEEKANRWFCNFTADEIEELQQELITKKETVLTSKEIIAR